MVFSQFIKRSVRHEKKTQNSKMQIINSFLLPVLGRTKVTEVTVAITFNVKPIGEKIGIKTSEAD